MGDRFGDTAFLVMIADLFSDGPDREGLGWIGIAGLIVTAVVSATLWNTHESGFADGFIVDRYALYFNLLFCVAVGLCLLMSMDYLSIIGVGSGEFYALVLFATVGMILMAAATDLIVLFLGLEVMSIAAYVLAGLSRRDLRSSEAALKYFLLGAFATGFLLFGIALLFGATGTTAIAAQSARLGELSGADRTMAGVGVGLLLVGFGFKIAVVPFHAWVPDVYEGSPTSVTALMAVAIKAAAFAAFVRVFSSHFYALAVDWTAVLWVLAILTMTLEIAWRCQICNLGQNHVAAFCRLAQRANVHPVRVFRNMEKVFAYLIVARQFVIRPHLMTQKLFGRSDLLCLDRSCRQQQRSYYDPAYADLRDMIISAIARRQQGYRAAESKLDKCCHEVLSLSR